MAGREGKTGLARVLPQKYWAENMKADGKKIGNRCKILLLNEDLCINRQFALFLDMP